MRWITLGLIGIACGGILWWFMNNEPSHTDLAADKGFKIPTFSEPPRRAENCLRRTALSATAHTRQAPRTAHYLFTKSMSQAITATQPFTWQQQMACALIIGDLDPCRKLKAWTKTMCRRLSLTIARFSAPMG